MRVESIEVSNIKGIAYQFVKTGAVTIISGRNGEGKSSFLDAVAIPFTGGHDPSLIRKGAEKGEVVIKLEDGATIRATVTPNATTLKVTSADGSVVKAPATYIKTLATSFAFDPISFLDARTPAEKEKRLKFLLDAMPISFTKAEIVKAFPSKISILGLKSEYSIEEFDALRAGKREERRTVDTDVERAEKANRVMRELLPEDDELRTLGRGKVDTYKPPENQWKVAVANIEAELSTAKAKLADTIAGFRNEGERMKAQVTAWELAEIDRIHREARERRTEIDVKVIQLIDEERKPIDEEIASITSALATAQEKASADLKASGVRESILSTMRQLEDLYERSHALDVTVKGLDEIRRAKLATLPVDGVEIRNGDIYFNDIAFDNVNLQQRIFIAFQIVALKMGALPLMMIDGLEQLDTQNREVFIEAVKESGYQVIAAEVTDAPLEAKSAA